MMPVSLSGWMLVGSVVVVLVGFRWQLADFLLDRFGALVDWMRGRRPDEDAT